MTFTGPGDAAREPAWVPELHSDPAGRAEVHRTRGVHSDGPSGLLGAGFKAAAIHRDQKGQGNAKGTLLTLSQGLLQFQTSPTLLQ